MLLQLLQLISGSLTGVASAQRCASAAESNLAAANLRMCSSMDALLTYLEGLRRDPHMCIQQCDQALQYLAPLRPILTGSKLQQNEASINALKQQVHCFCLPGEQALDLGVCMERFQHEHSAAWIGCPVGMMKCPGATGLECLSI